MARNNMPAHWQIKKLGELCGIVYGRGLPVKQLKPTGYPVFGANGIIGFNDKYLYEEPQVLISCRGAASGKINFSPAKCYVTNNSLILDIRKKEDLDKNYLFYALSIANKTKLVSGTAQPQVTINNAIELDIPLPTFLEQKAIVSKIEELLSDLENGKQQLQIVYQRLKVYRQSLLKWAFEGRFTSASLSEHDKRPLSEVEAGELPKGWKILKLKDITIEKEGLRRGPFGSSIKKEFFVPDGYKVYEQGNAINNDPYRGKYFVDEKKYQELINFKALPSDLIVSCSGVTLGRICELPEDAKPGIINQALLRIRLKKDLILNKYFVLHFRGAFFQKRIFDQSQGTAMPNLVGIKDFKEIEMFVPPINEQQLIVDELESKLTVCNKIEEIIIQSLQQSETLWQSILKKAFEGKLV